MGCGCAKVAKSQKEQIDDVRMERTKTEEDIKKLKAEIEKMTGPEPGTTGIPEKKPTEEQNKSLENLTRFSYSLKDIEEELVKADYNELSDLQDLLAKFFVIPSSKDFDNMSKQLDLIRAFLKKNLKPKVVKTQQEMSNQVNANVVKTNDEIKAKNLNIEEPANLLVKEFLSSLNKCNDEMNKGDYNNLQSLQDLIEALQKGFDAKNTDEVRKQNDALTEFFRGNLKPK